MDFGWLSCQCRFNLGKKCAIRGWCWQWGGYCEWVRGYMRNLCTFLFSYKKNKFLRTKHTENPKHLFSKSSPVTGEWWSSPSNYKCFIQNTVLGTGTGGRWPGGKAGLTDPSPGLHWGSSLTGGCWGLINTRFLARSCEPLRWKAQSKHRPEAVGTLGRL